MSNAPQQIYAPFTRAVEEFSALYDLRLWFSPFCFLRWRSDNHHDCYMSLTSLDSDRNEGCTLSAECRSPSFPITLKFLQYQVGTFQERHDPQAFWHALERGKAWADSCREAEPPRIDWEHWSAQLRSSNGYLRCNAVEAFGTFGEPRALDLLLPLLLDENMWLRYVAAEALGKIGDARTTLMLQRVAESDSKPSVRAAASYSLRQISKNVEKTS